MSRITTRSVGFALALLCLAAAGAQAQTREYTAGGRKFMLQVDQNAIWIPASAEETTPEQLKTRVKDVTASAIAAQARITREDPVIYTDMIQEGAAAVTLPRAKGTFVPRFQKLGGGDVLAIGQAFPRGAREVYKSVSPGGKVMRVLTLGSVVVQFKEAPTPQFLAEIRELYQLGEPEGKPYLKHAYSFAMKAPPGEVLADPFTVQNRLQQRYAQQVVFAEPEFAMEAELTGGVPDPLFGRQWHLGDDSSGLNIKAAWAKAGLRGSRDVPVAVIDTGIDVGHEDFNPANFVAPLDALRSPATPEASDARPKGAEAHGTKTVGLIAAVPDNGKGVAGIAPDCRIIPIRAFDASGLGTAAGTTSDAVARALAHAKASGARIINVSAEFPEDFLCGQVLSDLTKGDDLLIIAASGNSGNSVLFPAKSPHCMAVGATGRNSKRLAISNYTPQTYVIAVMAPSAPGTLLDGRIGEIVTTDVAGPAGDNPGGSGTRGDPDGHYYYEFNGTSAAAAQVSGVAALVWSIHPAFKASDVRDILQSTAKQTDPSVNIVDGRNDEYGYGRVDPVKAVEEALRRKAAMLGRGLGPRPAAAVAAADRAPVPVGDAAADRAARPDQPIRHAAVARASAPIERQADAAAAGDAVTARANDAPAVHRSASECEIASLDRKTVNFPSPMGGVETAHVDPSWVTVIGSPDIDAFIREIAPIVEPRTAKTVNDYLVRTGPVVRQDDKGIYSIPRRYLRTTEDLRAQARKGTELPTIQPVVEVRGGRLYPVGTLTVTVSERQAAELEKVFERLGLHASKVSSGKGHAVFKIKLTDESKFENIFDAASELGKKQELIHSVTVDSAAHSKTR